MIPAQRDLFDGTTVVYEFFISDTGIGMSEAFLKNQLFEPFSQEKSDARTQYKGTGLGMSIVKGLIRQMNGSIEVESSLEKALLLLSVFLSDLQKKRQMMQRLIRRPKLEKNWKGSMYFSRG